jgi:hypothetical protein
MTRPSDAKVIACMGIKTQTDKWDLFPDSFGGRGSRMRLPYGDRGN